MEGDLVTHAIVIASKAVGKFGKPHGRVSYPVDLVRRCLTARRCLSTSKSSASAWPIGAPTKAAVVTSKVLIVVVPSVHSEAAIRSLVGHIWDSFDTGTCLWRSIGCLLRTTCPICPPGGRGGGSRHRLAIPILPSSPRSTFARRSLQRQRVTRPPMRARARVAGDALDFLNGGPFNRSPVYARI
jgi:hypothetical protein